jgi:hypothetical protein
VSRACSGAEPSVALLAASRTIPPAAASAPPSSVLLV